MKKKTKRGKRIEERSGREVKTRKGKRKKKIIRTLNCPWPGRKIPTF